MKKGLFLIAVFVIIFLIFPITISEYGVVGSGPLAELGINQKLIFLGGYTILFYLVQPIYAHLFKINGYPFFFGDLNAINNLIYLGIVSAIITTAVYLVTRKLIPNFFK